MYLLRDGRAVGCGKNDFRQIEIDNSIIDTHVGQSYNNEGGRGIGIQDRTKSKELGWYFTGRKIIAISAG